jgi:hypothetical protein
MAKKPRDSKPVIMERGHHTVERTNVQHYQYILDSEMTITAIEKYLRKYFHNTNQVNTFASDNSLTIPTVSNKKDRFRNVAIEVWQQRRLDRGKERYPYPELIDSNA